MEVEKKVCKQCMTLKERHLAGKYPSGKDKKWRDNKGMLWAGHTCPDCHKNNCNERARKKKLNALS